MVGHLSRALAGRVRHRDAPVRGPEVSRRRPASQRPSAPSGHSTSRLDPVLHGRLRLGIASALSVARSMTFGELKECLGATDGNLSVHARRLEAAGYVVCEKRFDGRVPRSTFRLTATGRRALRRYLGQMEALIRVARGG